MTRAHTAPYMRWLWLTNLLGTLGYFSIITQWLWAILLLSYPLIVDRPAWLVPSHRPAAPQPIELGAFNPIVTGAAIVVSVAVVVGALVLIARMPRQISRASTTAVHTTAKKLMPVVTKHHEPSPRKRARLTYRIIVTLKLAACLLPTLLLAFARPIAGMPSEIIWIIGGFCMVCSLGYVLLQHIIARLAHIPRSRVW